MTPEGTEQELIVLRLLAKSEGPVGAGTVHEELAALGVNASEATVGRLLRDLDRRGLASRVGFRGRRLTDLGERRLAELAAASRQSAFAETLIERVFSPGRGTALDVLVARRAVEREIAKLAAGRKTPEYGERIENFLRRPEFSRKGGKMVPEAYRAFYRLLADVAGNEILTAIEEVLLGRDFFIPGLEEGVAVAEDLASIAAAVSKGDTEEAAAAAEGHVAALIESRSGRTR